MKFTLRQKITWFGSLITLFSIFFAGLIYWYLPLICLQAYRAGLIEPIVGDVVVEASDGWAPGFPSSSVLGRLLFSYPNQQSLILMKVDGLHPGFTGLMTFSYIEDINYAVVYERASLKKQYSWGETVFLERDANTGRLPAVIPKYHLAVTLEKLTHLDDIRIFSKRPIASSEK